MKRLVLIFSIGLFITANSFAQVQLPIHYRIDKQAMSYPMGVIEEISFGTPYLTKPINIKFNGSELYLFYDNHTTFLKEKITEVKSNADFEDDSNIISRRFYVLNENPTDTLMFVVDYDIPYVQIILPTKNAKGENVGYTSYKKYVSIKELAYN